MSPAAIALAVVFLIAAAVVAFVLRYKAVRDTFDLTSDERWHEQALADLPVEFIPDGFTCLRCEENPALPEKVWCAVCAPIVDRYPAEPIERGALEACIARHPAGKQRKTGGTR